MNKGKFMRSIRYCLNTIRKECSEKHPDRELIKSMCDEIEERTCKT